MDDLSAVRAEFRRNVTEARSQIASMRASVVRHRDAIDQANKMLADAWMALGTGDGGFSVQGERRAGELSNAPAEDAGHNNVIIFERFEEAQNRVSELLRES
jgi:hypothetical protein